MNNFEKIKNMTLDEMAEFFNFEINEISYLNPKYFYENEKKCLFDCEEYHCSECWKQWLQAESEG